MRWPDAIRTYQYPAQQVRHLTVLPRYTVAPVWWRTGTLPVRPSEYNVPCRPSAGFGPFLPLKSLHMGLSVLLLRIAGLRHRCRRSAVPGPECLLPVSVSPPPSPASLSLSPAKRYCIPPPETPSCIAPQLPPRRRLRTEYSCPGPSNPPV